MDIIVYELRRRRTNLTAEMNFKIQEFWWIAKIDLIPLSCAARISTT